MSPTEHRSNGCVLCAVWVCAEGERMTVVFLWQLKMWGFLDKAVFIRREFFSVAQVTKKCEYSFAMHL